MVPPCLQNSSSTQLQLASDANHPAELIGVLLVIDIKIQKIAKKESRRVRDPDSLIPSVRYKGGWITQYSFSEISIIECSFDEEHRPNASQAHGRTLWPF